MRKRTIKGISMALLAALLVAVFPAELSYAAVPDEINDPAEVTTFKSTEYFDQEYLRGYVTKEDDQMLKVIYRTPLETSLFRLSLYRIGDDDGGDMDLDIFLEPAQQPASDGTLTYNFTYYMNMADLEVPDGRYTIYIRRCATAEDAMNLKYTSSGVLNKNMVIQVEDGHVKILRYTDVISYNREIMAIGEQYDTSRYLDNTLDDIKFVLRNPATNVYATMSYDKIAFIKGVSDRVTGGVRTDYDKLRKIYEYTASNFFYDSVAFQTHSNQYADPYENIRNFEYGLSSVNSQQGRVYTTCQGYSAIFIALARAQGIPARMVYGHRAAVPSNDWTIEENVSTRDHWWVEAYADGRWIFVDPTVGTTNKYVSTTGKWTTTGLTNYTYFDPTEEQIATSHLYFNIYPDYRFGYYIENAYEIATLRAFLDSYSTLSEDSDEYIPDYSYGYGYGYGYGYDYDYGYGTAGRQIQNGKILDSNYAPHDYKTWGDGTKSHFMTDGRGNVAQIQWSNKGFTGALNLPDFQYMKLLSSHSNNFTSADLSGNTSLEKVYLYNNQLTSLDMTDCYSASYIRVKNNPMKNLTIYVNGQNRTFTAGDNGTFYFTLDTRYTDESFSLYSRPDVGYKVEGIYSTATGDRLSTKKTWHFTPKAAGYDIVFCLDPDSYKYTILPGDDVDGDKEYKADYLTAAMKRLTELGYYTPSYFDDETVYSGSMVDAAVKFQVIHDLPNTGNIGQMTWQILFSDDAQPMVSDYEYMQILSEYEARKALEAEAKSVMSAVDVQASSEAGRSDSGKSWMKISWTSDTVSDALESDDVDADSQLTAEELAQILPQDTGLNTYFDGFEVWKSTSKNSGYKLVRDTESGEKTSYKNTSGLKKGTRYYYKVRAYKLVGEEKIYSDWSNITYRKAK